MKPENVPKTVLDQFDEMKKKHPDAVFLFRIGDHYETYRQDALKAKQILGLELEPREIGGKQTDVARFKHYALDTYLPKLVRAGMRVAICEQLEDPKQKKKEKSEQESISNSTDMPRKKKEERRKKKEERRSSCAGATQSQG